MGLSEMLLTGIELADIRETVEAVIRERGVGSPCGEANMNGRLAADRSRRAVPSQRQY